MAFLVLLPFLLALVGTSVQHLTMTSSCGEAKRGVIGYPFYHNPRYKPNLHKSVKCTWTVKAEPEEHVKLKISLLQVGGPNGDCDCGSLLIYDGCREDKFLVEKICSSNFIPEGKYLWISWGSCLTVEFTARNGSDNSFLLITDDTAVSCGEKLLTSNQTFSSPSQLSYVEPQLCVWIIDARQARVFTELQFLMSFGIGSRSRGETCDGDFVRVKQGRFSSSEVLGTYCGDTRPYPVTSRGRYLRISMLQKSTTRNDGFTAHYSFLSGVQKPTYVICDQVVEGTSGQIASRFYPQQYPPDLKCQWTIKLPKGDRVSLKFEDFDLEGSLGDEECRNDVVEVHNGPASWSPTMGKFCGKSLPRWLHSDSNQMRIFFKSNKQYAGRGFKATYEVYKETDADATPSGHFTGIMIGTTCGIIFVVLSALAVFHTRKMRLRRAQPWQSDTHSTQSFDVHRASAPPDYDLVMASPEMFPSAPRQSNRVYSELPHLHREISHLLGDPDSDDENLPGYEELERRGMIQISTHSSVPGTTRDQPGSKQEEEDHFPAVWYRRSSEGPKDHRAPEEHSSTDV